MMFVSQRVRLDMLSATPVHFTIPPEEVDHVPLPRVTIG
jgi:hypothetical protein